MAGVEIIWAAFLMGAVGSLHCIGMCGPLALALPVHHNNNWSRIAGGAVYNFGRITTYALLGLITGSLGQAIISSHWQGILSIVMGALVMGYIFLPKLVRVPVGFPNPSVQPLVMLRKALWNLFEQRKYRSIFSIGLLNGLLPCGMIYMALLSSFVTGTAVGGSLFMIFFGLGTFPAMLGVVFFGSYMNQQVRLRLRRSLPVFLFIMASLLILRGMNLGIPYLSPGIPSMESGETIVCH
jgi:uncharacterized protein